MKKNIRTALMIIAVGVMLIVVGCVLRGSIQKEDFISGSCVPAASESKVVVAHKAAVKNLFVDVDAGHVVIVPHHANSFAYSIGNNTDVGDLAVVLDGAALKITAKHTKKWFGLLDFFGSRIIDSPRITVYIPYDTVFTAAEISTGTAQTLLEGFTAQNRFMLQTGVSKTTVRNVIAHNVLIKTGVGKNSFDNCTFTDTCMETGIGETSFDGVLLGSSVIRSGIGQADIQINMPRNLYAISVVSGIGETFINGSKVSGWKGSVKTDSSTLKTKNRIDVKSGIGVVKLHFQ